MAKRKLSRSEEQNVINIQRESDGSLRCFISGEVINEDSDELEFDHVDPFSKGGSTDLNNIKAVLKKYNRRKSDQTLYEVRDNLKLERLFQEKKNSIKLQDILSLKSVEYRTVHITQDKQTITITDGTEQYSFALFKDSILNVDYFYGRIPLKWIQNDDQEGLQPRVIDYKRLLSLRKHLKDHPQIAPAVARLLGSVIRLFDGQHKIAAQTLNNVIEIDVKVYVSPENEKESKKLFDSLMITNLEAHSKLRQVPFYTSTVYERLSVIYKEYWEEFISQKPPAQHSEVNFISFLVSEKEHTKASASAIFRAAVKESVLSQSPLSPFIAEASKDKNFPITQDLMESIFPYCIYLHPSNAIFGTTEDFRRQEVTNFYLLCELLVEYGLLNKWNPRVSNISLSSEELKPRRIWHKGSVLTWAPYLKDIISNAFNMVTEQERTQLLYRTETTSDQKGRIEACLKRLFGHSMWDMPEGQIDTLLSSSKKQDDFFKQYNLTPHYVVVGQSMNS